MTCRKLPITCFVISVAFMTLGASQTVLSSSEAKAKSDISPALACKRVRSTLSFQPSIVLPPEKEWMMEATKAISGGERIRVYDIWVNPDRKKPERGFHARVLLESGLLVSFHNIARNDLRYRTDRSMLPLRYGTEKQANQLITTVAKKLGVLKPGLKLEFQHKLGNKRKPSIAGGIRDSSNNVVVTIECDPVDGTILHFWRMAKI